MLSMTINAQTIDCKLGFSPDNTWIDQTFDQSSQLLSYSGENIEVGGIIYVTQGVTLTISANCTLNFAPNAKIIVEDGARLYADESVFLACGNSLWDGIFVEYGSYIEIHGNEFYDAINAISSTNGGNYMVYSNLFEKCYLALKVTDYNGDHLGRFYDNAIIGSQYILQGSNYTHSGGGISIENVISLTQGYKLLIGDNNLTNFIYGYFDLAVDIDNSDVHIENVDIDCSIGHGIHFMGGSSSADIRNVDFSNVYIHSNYQNLTFGIWGLDNFNTEISNCSINVDHDKIILLSNSHGEINIHDNLNLESAGQSSNSNNILNIVGDVVNGVIFSNKFENNCLGTGISISNSTNLTIESNQFNLSAIQNTGIEVSYSNNIIIKSNIIDCSFSAKGISIMDYVSQVEISNNDITFLNNWQTNNGVGISLSNNCSHLNIYNNRFSYGKGGIDLTNLCSNITIANNNFTGQTQFGIYEYWLNGFITIQENVMNLQYGVGIYFSWSYDHFVFSNEINFTSSNFLFARTGISCNNPAANDYFYISYNRINLYGYSTSNCANSVGIFLENNPYTHVSHNTIRNAGYGLFFNGNNYTGVVSCNSLIDSYHGIQLFNAIIGVYSNSYNAFCIGEFADPYDNYWSIIGANGRVYGNIVDYSHIFYFKYSNSGSTPYTLLSGEYNVTSSGQASFTTSPTPPGNYCGSPPPPVAPLLSLSTSALDNYRESHIGFIIDSISLTSLGSSSSIMNPQSIYSNSVRYYTVQSAYNQLKNNGQLINLGLSSDAKYAAFIQVIDASNIGLIYTINSAIENQDYTLANQLLQNYMPNSLIEFNTFSAYEKLIQFVKTDSLSGADSVFLNSIAQQSTNIGGQGVYIARNLLGLYIIDNTSSNTSSTSRMSTSIKTNSYKIDEFINSYPNPADNYYMIDIAGDYFAILAYELFSIDGRLILRGIINNKSQNRIDISKLESGVYFIKVFNDFELVYNSKLIKN